MVIYSSGKLIDLFLSGKLATIGSKFRPETPFKKHRYAQSHHLFVNRGRNRRPHHQRHHEPSEESKRRAESEIIVIMFCRIRETVHNFLEKEKNGVKNCV
ncbi:hypothetical protein L2E82_22952 [Cichorium intybus]|uniref:Uncharacterized protein n=1 Tax=Cichorium intybus TaxID=13427 RepID=A0ACB9DZE0_CICIN|nr:hypothetical protein L2E82_22952 [Cichorium intybus]